MKAVVVTTYGDAEVLKLENRALPQIKPTEVLIAVKAAGINRPDIFQRQGNYPAPAGVVPDILGLEVAGVVSAIGADVLSLQVGDKVMALVAGGGYAEYVSVSASNCILIPRNITFEEAAGMSETLFTVWSNVFQRGKLNAGEKLLVHGGTGGIGLTAIQLAVLMGNEVYTTVGSDEKKAFVEELGAKEAFNYHKEDFEEKLNEVGIHVILDSIGGAYFAKNVNVLADDGRLVQINAMQGAKVELNLIKLMQKRIFLTGSTLRNRSVQFKAEIARDLEKHVMPLIAQGLYKTYIEQVFPVSEVIEAHKLMESRDFIGKIILRF